MSRKLNVAVVGATGVVGEVMLELLAARRFPVSGVTALASAGSAGRRVSFGRRELVVRELAGFDFNACDIALFSAGSAVSEEYAPRAAAAGCVVIDNTSRFRMDPDVPLVIPEINGAAVDELCGGGIIANPNCSTIQMLLAIAPIHQAVGVSRINVATYQSVSGAGRSALEALARQTADQLNFRDPKARASGAPIAFNVIPRIDLIEDNGYTREEMKMHNETRRILDDNSIQVNATAVRVPVFYGHAEAVHLETRMHITVERVRELLASAHGVELLADGESPTPVTHAAGKDPVFVGRIRRDFTHPNGIDLWVVADNVRKGAALNAIQIAELVTKRRAVSGRASG